MKLQSDAIKFNFHAEFEQVFDDGIACSQEFEQHANNFVPDMYSDLKQR